MNPNQMPATQPNPYVPSNQPLPPTQQMPQQQPQPPLQPPQWPQQPQPQPQFQQPPPTQSFPAQQPQQSIPGQSGQGMPPSASPPQVPPAPQELADVVTGSQEVLCRAKSVFPFVLFPDTIAVDREKVTITHKSFFKTGDTASINIDDILSVTANTGPFFGSIKLTIRNIPQNNPPVIEYLSRRDVLCIKNVLQGYIIARRNNVDCASLPRKELVDLLQRLGSGQASSPAA